MYRDYRPLALADLSPSLDVVRRQIDEWKVLEKSIAGELSAASVAAAALEKESVATAALAANETVTRTLAEAQAAAAKALLGGEITRIAEEATAARARLHEIPQLEAVRPLGELSSAQVADISRVAEQVLRQVDWQRLDQVFRGGLEIHQAAADLIGAYADLDVFGQIERSLDFSLRSFPALEVYGHSSLLRSLSHLGVADPAEAEEDEEQEAREELGERGRVSLQALMQSRHPKLLHMWVGARKALDSPNPDRIRQYCVSQRELLLTLLRQAAPDHAVRAWTDEPKHFHNRDPDNQPTWPARLHFLCAQADREDYGSFVVLDARSALKIYRLLNKGVHEVEPGFDSRQIGDLRLRADNLLLFVLMLSVEGKN